MEKIKLFIMDVDGTLTNGKIYMGNDGEIFKVFNIKDGYGIKLLKDYSIIPVIITGRNSRIVENRANEVGITEIYQGISNKIEIVDILLKKYNVTYENVAYIGDDLNDLEIMKKSGLTFAPFDCAVELIDVVNHHLQKNGGEGAVREAIDIIIKGEYYSK